MVIALSAHHTELFPVQSCLFLAVRFICLLRGEHSCSVRLLLWSCFASVRSFPGANEVLFQYGWRVGFTCFIAVCPKSFIVCMFYPVMSSVVRVQSSVSVFSLCVGMSWLQVSRPPLMLPVWVVGVQSKTDPGRQIQGHRPSIDMPRPARPCVWPGAVNQMSPVCPRQSPWSPWETPGASSTCWGWLRIVGAACAVHCITLTATFIFHPSLLARPGRGPWFLWLSVSSTWLAAGHIELSGAVWANV